MHSRARASRAPDQLGRGVDQQVGGLGERGAQGGVDHVRRGEAVVDPRSLGWADRRLHHVDEGGHVVIGDLLAVGDRLDEGGVDHRRARPGTRRPTSAGTSPTSAQPSVASSSTSSHMAKRASSVKSSAISAGA